MRLSPGLAAARVARRFPLFFYLAGVVLLTGAFTVAFVTWWSGTALALALLAIPFVMCALHLGIAIAHWAATVLVKPRPLPRLDFSTRIPPEQRTLVVVPTLLTSADGVHDLLDALEVRFLANREANLHFGLLTDLADAPQEVMPADAELVRLAREGIELLSKKYEAYRTDIFFLFHRPRRWNAQEGVWMGYERKRGKLLELNGLLRGIDGKFEEIIGDTSVLPAIRHVITLDTDTQLPHDAAHQMIGTIAHILNKPVYDSDAGALLRATEFCSRVWASACPAPGARGSCACLQGPGVDPYTRVVSDVYQDLFGEGSFVGKGIYEVDAFEAPAATFPRTPF